MNMQDSTHMKTVGIPAICASSFSAFSYSLGLSALFLFSHCRIGCRIFPSDMGGNDCIIGLTMPFVRIMYFFHLCNTHIPSLRKVMALCGEQGGREGKREALAVRPGESG